MINKKSDRKIEVSCAVKKRRCCSLRVLKTDLDLDLDLSVFQSSSKFNPPFGGRYRDTRCRINSGFLIVPAGRFRESFSEQVPRLTIL